MDKETKVETEEPKIDLFEDDDEFEEFEINEGDFTSLFLNYFYVILMLSVTSYSTVYEFDLEC